MKRFVKVFSCILCLLIVGVSVKSVWADGLHYDKKSEEGEGCPACEENSPYHDNEDAPLFCWATEEDCEEAAEAFNVIITQKNVLDVHHGEMLDDYDDWKVEHNEGEDHEDHGDIMTTFNDWTESVNDSEGPYDDVVEELTHAWLHQEWAAFYCLIPWDWELVYHHSLSAVDHLVEDGMALERIEEFRSFINDAEWYHTDLHVNWEEIFGTF